MFILGGILITLTMALLIALIVDLALSLALGSGVLGFFGWSAVLIVGFAAVVVLRVRAPLHGAPINYVSVGSELKQMHRHIRYYTPGLKAEWITGIEPLDQMLVGPRMIIAGVRQNAGADAVLRQRFFDRCAHMLHKLASVGEGVDVKWLFRDKHEPIAIVEQIIAYLEKHDWVGANSTHQKVWLSSQAKQVLPYMGVRIGNPNEI